jgi:predicted type IV restriction endonuclease
MNIPSRVETRLINGIKRFQPILASAKARDVNESDTVIIVTDMLSELFGYDKYSEITSEHAIRGTFCDLATKLNGKVELLLEVKAIGLERKDAYVKQAIDYAANKGVEWVVLTNGTNWRIYKVTFAKPIDAELVCEVDFLSTDPKNTEHLEQLYTLTKEGWQKSVLSDLREQRQALSRFVIAAFTMSEPVLDVMRRELKRLCPDVRIQNEQILNVLLMEVLKRDVVEGDKADEAKRKVTKASNRALRVKADKTEGLTPVTPVPVTITVAQSGASLSAPSPS